MSQIVANKGVVPLQSVEGVAVFYVTGWVGGKSQYAIFIQYPPGIAREDRWSGDNLDLLSQKQHLDNDLLAEVCALWREFRRDYEDNPWTKRAESKKAQVALLKPKSDRTLIH